MPHVIYLRKSRADMEAEARGEGETLARHERTLKALAAQRGDDIKPEHIYREIVSGDTISERPIVQHLLREVEAGLWDGVYVMEVERIARGDTMDQGRVAQAFKYTDTRIITPMKVYDPSDEMDEEYFEFSLFMARREYKTIKRRMQAGRIASVKEGHYLGTRMPFGYDRLVDKNGKGYSLKPNPETAPITRAIFEWYADGIGANTIAHKLNAMGIKTTLGKMWETSSIVHMLDNPTYIGMVQWNQRKQAIEIRDGERIKTRPRSSEYICVKGQHEPIISDAIWQRVRAIKAGHRRPPVHENTTIQNPLAGLVKCGVCGRSLVRRPHKRGDMFRCTTPYCAIISTYISIVEEMVLEALSLWLKDYAPKHHKKAKSDSIDIDAMQAARQHQKETIKTLNQQKSRLFDLVERGLYTDEMFVTRNAELSARIAEAEQLLASLTVPQNIEDAMPKLLPKVRSVLSAYKIASTPAEKNALLKTVISEVVYNKSVKCTRNDNPADHVTLVIHPLIPRQ